MRGRMLTFFGLGLAILIQVACNAPATEGVVEAEPTPVVEAPPPAKPRPMIWVDVYGGEPVTFEDMMDDLAGVDVIYLGERHEVEHHHTMQQRVIAPLAERDVPLVVGLEMLPFDQQPHVDRYNAGEIDFDKLAELTDWKRRWSNYEDYRGPIEAARKAGGLIVALNAKLETVRQVAAAGIDGLDAEMRAEPPDEMLLDDPMYERDLNRVMMVHKGVTEEMLQKFFEAQVTRDETMADRLCRFLQSEQGKGRTAVVLCGSGHVSHGLGTPTRVRIRMPDSKDRIVVMADCGDVELSEAMKAHARAIEITHEQIRDLDKPIADYLLVRPLKEE